MINIFFYFIGTIKLGLMKLRYEFMPTLGKVTPCGNLKDEKGNLTINGVIARYHSHLHLIL